MAWRWPGNKPLSEPMLVSLLTYICITRPQWVKVVFACSSSFEVEQFCFPHLCSDYFLPLNPKHVRFCSFTHSFIVSTCIYGFCDNFAFWAHKWVRWIQYIYSQQFHLIHLKFGFGNFLFNDKTVLQLTYLFVWSPCARQEDLCFEMMPCSQRFSPLFYNFKYPVNKVVNTSQTLEHSNERYPEWCRWKHISLISAYGLLTSGYCTNTSGRLKGNHLSVATSSQRLLTISTYRHRSYIGILVIKKCQ